MRADKELESNQAPHVCRFDSVEVLQKYVILEKVLNMKIYFR